MILFLWLVCFWCCVWILSNKRVQVSNFCFLLFLSPSPVLSYDLSYSYAAALCHSLRLYVSRRDHAGGPGQQNQWGRAPAGWGGAGRQAFSRAGTARRGGGVELDWTGCTVRNSSLNRESMGRHPCRLGWALPPPALLFINSLSPRVTTRRWGPRGVLCLGDTHGSLLGLKLGLGATSRGYDVYGVETGGGES